MWKALLVAWLVVNAVLLVITAGLTDALLSLGLVRLTESHAGG